MTGIQEKDTPGKIAIMGFVKAYSRVTASDVSAAVQPTPSHALSEAERAKPVLAVDEPRFCAVPPARIMPMLADEGLYLDSESSFAVCCASTDSRPPRTSSSLCAAWCWDMTYLPAQVMRALVLPVPDSRLVQPQDRSLGGA